MCLGLQESMLFHVISFESLQSHKHLSFVGPQTYPSEPSLPDLRTFSPKPRMLLQMLGVFFGAWVKED